MSILNPLSASALVGATVPRNWTVKNTTGVDIVLLDSYSDSIAPEGDLYELTLQPLATSQDGVSGTKTVIPNGKSGKVTFGDPHVSTELGDPLDYTIIIARADSLFPVQIVYLSADNVGDFATVEVTLQDILNMQNAEVFNRSFVAFPVSDLAQQFATAAQKDDVTAVDDFFKGTTNFSKVTATMINAINSYYIVYPYGWSDYSRSKAFDIYKIEDDSRKPLGTLTLDYSGTAPMDPDKALPKFKATYTSQADGKTVDIKYSNGQFVDDPNSDTPAKNLAGSFKQNGELTGDNDDNTLVTCAVGTIDGNTVIAVNQTPDPSTDQDGNNEPDPNAGKDEGFFDLLEFANIRDYCDTFVYVITVAISVAFVIKLGLKIRHKYKGKQGDDPADRDMIDKKFLDMRTKLENSVYKVLKAVNDLKPAPAPEPVMPELNAIANPRLDPAAVFAKLKLRQQNYLTEVGRKIVSDAIDAQWKYLDKLTNLNGRAANGVADKLDAIERTLGELQGAALGPHLDDLMQQLQGTADLLKGAQARYGGDLRNQALDTMNAAKDTVIALDEQAEENSRLRDQNERRQMEDEPPVEAHEEM